MTKIIEFLSDGIDQTSLVTTRLENLLNARIKDRGSMSSEDVKVLHALKNTVSQGQVAAIVEADSEQYAITLQELHWLEKHDESNWVDYLVHRYKFRMFPKTKKVSDFPTYLLIEPTSVCNLRCVMCFQVDETFTLDKSFMGLMSWELFTSVVDQAADNGCQAITMASRGEPTLHKRFGEMLHYVSSKGLFDTKINTNATRLNEKLIHDILSSEISNVTFSVDAITAESYEKIRVKGKFDEVLANVKLFNQIRAADYPNSPTTTRISGVAVVPDQDPVEMQQFWSKLVDEVTIVPNIHRFDSYNNPRFNRKEACSILWSRMYVWWDGTCNPCDFDYKSLLKVGNANEQSIAEIWNGERYTRYRELHENMRRSELNPCDRCPL